MYQRKINPAEPVQVDFERHGVVLSSDGSDWEAWGVINPGVARSRQGELLLYPRKVAQGNVSRIGLAREGTSSGGHFERLGVIVHPETDYELRSEPGGFGCEDARVTFIPKLDKYIMAYAAFGRQGPRIALATSDDGYQWKKLGPVLFADGALNALDNKDAAFFPEPVYSPAGVLSFAMYHRPMLPFSVNGQAPISTILQLDPADRESMWIAYMSAESVLEDLENLRYPRETVRVLPVDSEWGKLKNGAGTPPVRSRAGWLSIFHAVDSHGPDHDPKRTYSAGIVIHDLHQPHRVLYRSPEPLIVPLTIDESVGIVDNVVFPTGLDVISDGVYDVYYGAADHKILRARLSVEF
ncbi:MAG TPA: hypothetical protein VKT51_13150 [Candidatus Eremiobacteraceae bacterium]|nr:hypothetical protein [Candidatus Eremiobacteraceae bacterium]